MSFASHFTDRLYSAIVRITNRRKNVRSRLVTTLAFEPLERREMLAVDISPAPFLQWFEASYDTINERTPDLFEAGYGAV